MPATHEVREYMSGNLCAAGLFGIVAATGVA